MNPAASGAGERWIGAVLHVGVWAAHVSAVGVIAAADYATGPDVELSAIYLVPIVSAAYRWGRALSGTIAILAAAAWYIDSDLVRSGSGSVGILAWNGLSRLAIYLVLALTVDQLRRQHAEVLRLAATDELTGLPNARSFAAQLRSEVFRAERYGHELALLLVDCDDLKRINDTHGHGAGNEVLSEVGQLLAHAVRGPDLAARWGGDEFAVLQPETTLEGAGMTAARIRELVNSLRLTSASAEPIRVTVSIGIAMSPIAGMTSEADLFHAADRALYDAKRGGKDRINTATVSAAGGGQTDDVGRAVRQSNRAAAENPSLER